MEEYPDSALSWFAVGCYYMAARHFEAARRYFSKATGLDRNSPHAWVGFGHAFAAQVGRRAAGGLGRGWEWIFCCLLHPRLPAAHCQRRLRCNPLFDVY